MPVALSSTSTSPARGPSRSSSTISSGLAASKATAARVFMDGLLCGDQVNLGPILEVYRLQIANAILGDVVTDHPVALGAQLVHVDIGRIETHRSVRDQAGVEQSLDQDAEDVGLAAETHGRVAVFAALDHVGHHPLWVQVELAK